jgi:hypothetical protein
MEKIDKVISCFRKLNEEGMVTASVPVNKVGDGGFTSRADPKGPVAGLDPVMRFVRRKKVDYRTVPNNYKKWVKNLDKKS